MVNTETPTKTHATALNPAHRKRNVEGDTPKLAESTIVITKGCISRPVEKSETARFANNI